MAPQREWFEKDYYKTLGVSSTATAKEITSAYRKLAKKHHPDTNPGEEETFKEISAAYDVLGDADRRKEYDEVRTMGPAAGAGGFPGGFGGPGAGGHLPGGGHGRPRRPVRRAVRSRGPAGRRGHRAPARRRTSRPSSTCPSRTPSRGHHLGQPDHRRPLPHLRRERVGPGHPAGHLPPVPGTGTLQDNQGLFSLSQICPQCQGRGTIVTTPCPTCSGTGVEHRNRSVKVRIPAGVEDGQRIRVKGRGAAGRGNGPSGDLYVVVRVDRHGLFGRRGRNLTLTVPVSYPEATLGTTLTVPTLGRTGDPAGAGGDPVGPDLPGQGPGGPGRQEERHRRPAGHRGGGRSPRS